MFAPELKFTRDFSKDRQQLKLRITPLFASDGYMDYYYEVTPAFATAQRPAFAPEAVAISARKSRCHCAGR